MFCWTFSKDKVPARVHTAPVAVKNKLYCFGGVLETPLYRHRGVEKDTPRDQQIAVFNTVSLRWEKLPPATNGAEGVTFRLGHTAVLIGDTVYIWGGARLGWREQKDLSTLYAFDVETHGWFKPRVSGTAPEGRTFHSACVLGEVMFIHGGYNPETGYHNDMYKLDTSTMVWSLIKTRGTVPPPASSGHSTIIGTKMFVFGGGGNNSDIRVFDTETEHWLNVTAPIPDGRRDYSAFAYNGELYIFGGQNSEWIFCNLWRFNPEIFSWKEVTPVGKRPPASYGMRCCTVGDHVILFGGYTDGGNKKHDLYFLHFNSTLKMLCKLAVIQYRLDHSELPHDIRWELIAMTTNSKKRKRKI